MDLTVGVTTSKQREVGTRLGLSRDSKMLKKPTATAKKRKAAEPEPIPTTVSKTKKSPLKSKPVLKVKAAAPSLPLFAPPQSAGQRSALRAL